MAGAYCAACAILTPTISLNTNRMQLLVSASSTTCTKHVKRKNYLRPKILKTLTKPYSPPTNTPLPQEPLELSIIPITSPEILHQELPANESSESCATVSGEDDKVKEFSFSETSGGYNGSVSKLSTRFVLKFGVYVLGAFVFQTICAVWVLGNANSDKRDGNWESSDSGEGEDFFNGNEKLVRAKFETQKSNVIYMDDYELEGKIEEIRAMARDARKAEKKSSEDSGGDERLNSRHRIGIEKEIGGRLLKLQKKLNSDKEKSLGSHVNYLGKSQKGEDGMNSNGKLAFEKKLKFRSPSTERKKSPKGFGGSQENSVSKSKKGSLGSIDKTTENGRVGSGAMELSDRVNEEIQPESNMVGKDDGRRLAIESTLSQNDQKKNGAKEMGVGITKPRKSRNGIIQGSGLGWSSVEVAKSGASRELGKDYQTSLNGTRRSREAENKPSARKVQEKKSSIETEMWWFNLPYVLFVLMRRGSDPEGPEGLYTLKNGSQSCTVAFEDRGDANNFCFLLESFFEDLGDFRADIIPLSVKELRASVNSKKMKVVVIKKGQLQLYAGQPFADVEMALRSLVEGNQID
ncbi:hypothetical protein FNV43_RR00870 [Rhamnella rubrinervis]|uniref:Uncharacterized protein n=1 Tax=Rhamnella rubrinervis TaxID=2594499 RepID=A0A8K0HPF1_9ROSA|nr:hypothetical protein FNV43_RR00870 [Rhamnella rubrinervis]